MNKKKLFWGTLIVIAMIVCIVAITYIFIYFFSNNNSSEYIKETSSSENVSADTSEMAENHNIDWDKLLSDNSDIYAWIYVPDTNVDYAVVRSTGDEKDDFYLNHNLKKNYEFAGSIYSEIQNATDFSDPVTILYGHNMKNGTMFATLHKFEDATFFKEHKYMYIYMPGHKLTYKIYAAYVYDDRHILNSFDFSKQEVLTEYLKYTLDPASMNRNTRNVKLNSNSKILTLSTCTNGAENTRYLVQGVLIKNEQTN